MSAGAVAPDRAWPIGFLPIDSERPAAGVPTAIGISGATGWWAVQSDGSAKPVLAFALVEFEDGELGSLRAIKPVIRDGEACLYADEENTFDRLEFRGPVGSAVLGSFRPRAALLLGTGPRHPVPAAVLAALRGGRIG